MPTAGAGDVPEARRAVLAAGAAEPRHAEAGDICAAAQLPAGLGGPGQPAGRRPHPGPRHEGQKSGFRFQHSHQQHPVCQLPHHLFINIFWQPGSRHKGALHSLSSFKAVINSLPVAALLCKQHQDPACTCCLPNGPDRCAQARYDMVYNTEGGMAVKKEAAGRDDGHDSKRVKAEK